MTALPPGAVGPYQSPITLGDYLTANARRIPDSTCIVLDDGTRYSFRDVNRRVNQLVSALLERGYEKGDRIGVLATDRAAFVELVLACAKSGLVYLPLNYRLSPPEVELLMRDGEPRALFVTREYVDLADALTATVPGIDLVVDFDDGDNGLIAYGDLLEGQSCNEPDIRASDDDLLAIAYTSGTTGLPKGVLQPQGMFHAMIRTLIAEARCTNNDFRYSAAPLFHVSGVTMPLLGVVLGFPTLILPQFDPSRVVHWMQHGGLTDVFMVPTMIAMTLDVPGVEDHDYAQLRHMLYGAAPMPPTLLRRAIEVYGCGFFQMFGAGTEGGLQTVLTVEDHRRALDGHDHILESVGRPPFGLELRLCDPDGAELVDVEPGAVGEIVTRSNMVMLGYYRRHDESERVLVDGWFRGGDLARIDDDGYLYLAGRAKDMIIRGGENVYPIEIETVLYDFPGVREVAVIGEADDRWGEIVVAVLSVEGEVPEVDELRDHCRARLASYKVPQRIEFRNELPRNASGKILKRVLRDELETNRPKQVAGA